MSNNEIALLRRMLNNLTVQPTAGKAARRRRARQRRRQQQQQLLPVMSNPAGILVNPNPNSGGTNRRRKKNKKTMSSNSPGEVVIRRSELLLELTGNVSGIIDVIPSQDTMPWLNKIAPAFERVKWISLIISYKPFCGANVSGSVICGPDWNSSRVSTTKPTRRDVQVCTPIMEVPVWSPGRLVLPSAQLMTRKAYDLVANTAIFDRQPCQILYNVVGSASSVTVGELWIDYHVVLSGTTA
nr:MAG: VP3 protein [Solemoviridae sp. 4]